MWFGDGDTNIKTEGGAGGGRVKDVNVFIGRDQDGQDKKTRISVEQLGVEAKLERQGSDG